MSGTIEYLLGAGGERGWVAMKKAGLALVTVNLAAWPREPAELQFLLTPKQLRQLGAAADSER
ncbi:MAG: hypothetical protein HYU66_28095 [Armatimonadetes bacterium]|nr:hypothetical protein [Armatimonadota bacterium]